MVVLSFPVATREDWKKTWFDDGENENINNGEYEYDHDEHENEDKYEYGDDDDNGAEDKRRIVALANLVFSFY